MKTRLSALLRYPGLLAGGALGCVLLTMVLAAFPLFLSASASELVAGDIRGIATRAGAGVVYSSTDVRLGDTSRGAYPAYTEIDALFRAEMRDAPALGDVYRGAIGPQLEVRGDGSQAVPGVLFSAQGAAEHITVVDGSIGDGVLLPDARARTLGVAAGDDIRLQLSGRTVTVRLAGVYRDLSSLPHSTFWHPWNDRIYGTKCILLDCPAPPALVITSLSTMASLSHELGTDLATFTWEAPVRAGDVTLSDARSLAAFFMRFQSRISPGGPLFDQFQCCDNAIPHAELYSAMPGIADAASIRISEIESPAFLLRAAGILVALAVLISAGVFLIAARPVEARLLVARGAEPARVAAGLSAEVLVPSAIACAVGLVLSIAAVRLVGPGGRIEGSAMSAAVRAAVIAVPASIAVLVGAAMVAFLRQSEHHRARLRAITALPWELVPAAASLLALRRLRSAGAFVHDANGIQRPSIWLLGFSVLFVAGFGTLGARVCLVVYRWWRSRSEHARPESYLAARRLTAFPGPTFALVAVVTLCLGISVESLLLVASMRATVDAKAGIFVGSDVAGWIDQSTPDPRSFPLPITRVARVRDAGTIAGTSTQFALLSIDPATFARAAYWRSSFSSSSLDDLMHALRDSSDRASLPAIVVGDVDVGAVRIEEKDIPLDVVGRAEAFPAMSSGVPLVVVDQRWMNTNDAGQQLLLEARVSDEWWVRGDTDRARTALHGLRYPPYLVLTAERVKDIPSLAAMIETFLVLDVLGAAAALLAIAGTTMYLQARQRAHLVAYALSLRMGMTHRTNTRSLRRELAIMLGSALVIGAILAAIAGRIVAPLIDPLPTVPPQPLLAVPWAPFALGAALVVVAALAGARFTAWRVRGVELGEVMRVAE
jgi:putative ABC transport system permease protein